MILKIWFQHDTYLDVKISISFRISTFYGKAHHVMYPIFGQLTIRYCQNGTMIHEMSSQQSLNLYYQQGTFLLAWISINIILSRCQFLHYFHQLKLVQACPNWSGLVQTCPNSELNLTAVAALDSMKSAPFLINLERSLKLMDELSEIENRKVNFKFTSNAMSPFT